MKFSEARKLGWPEVMAKGKKHYILMYGILPFAIGALASSTINVFIINKLLSYTTEHIIFVYIMNLIIFSLIGFFSSNRIWKSNIKNFAK